MNVEIKYLTAPHDGQPGAIWDDFSERLRSVAAGQTDKRGYSLADTMDGTDEGGPAPGPGVPAIPVGAAGNVARTARRVRLRRLYELVYTHESAQDHRTHMYNHHFQDGHAAWNYLEGLMRTPPTAMELRAMNKRFDDIDILTDIGINANTIIMLNTKIKAVNAKFPAAHRKDQTACTERLLECISGVSKHFHQPAILEYNALPGARQFELPAVPPALVGQRDFQACTAHFHVLWKTAVDDKLAGFGVRAPQARPAPNVRQTLEAGLKDAAPPASGESLLLASAGSADFYVPRPISPGRTLHRLAEAGDDLARTHNVTTTTDWGMLTEDEVCAACVEGGVEGEFETMYMLDSDGAASIEIICDCCRGFGHVRRVCPSNHRTRSLEYAIAGLKAKLESSGQPRRSTLRGQRPPFRAQPRRYSNPSSRSGGPARRSYVPNRARSAEEGESGFASAEDARSEYSCGSSISTQHTGSTSGSSGKTREVQMLAREQPATEQPKKSETARERGHVAAEPPEAIQQPMTFSDNQLFQRETMFSAVERPSQPTPQAEQSPFSSFFQSVAEAFKRCHPGAPGATMH